MRVLITFCVALPLSVGAQLQPGYSASENIEMLKVFKSFVDTPIAGMDIPASTRFHRVYRSPVMGLDNMWELHADDRSTAVISLRGTTANAISWLENGYAAMIPATGEMQLEEDFSFRYHLADDPRAAVHVGWMLGVGFLQRDILPRIDSLYAVGTRDILITGHSQGGALCYLFTAHVWQLQRAGRIPGDIRFKTYANAAPKPGNTYFAHHYEHHTRGWAFNTVNALDWVPEVPMSIQTVDDFNTVNPFTNAKEGMKDLPLKQRVAAKYVYNKLDKPTRRAQSNYRKFLGKSASSFVRRSLPHLETPPYAETNLYVRTGTIITLLPDSEYFHRFPQEKERIFINHMLEPYLYLMERYTHDARDNDQQADDNVEEGTNQQAFRERKIRDGIGFYSLGHEPEWMLDINFEKGVGFRTLEDGQGWFATAIEPEVAEDGSLLFNTRTERGELQVVIQEQGCMDSMSGEEFPYTVRVVTKDTLGEQQYSGCGSYLPPQRLHDVWILHRLNGDVIRQAELRNGARLEFNTGMGTMLGGGGCNRITATFEAGHQNIVFGPISRTKVYCEGYPGTVESAFLTALDVGPLRVHTRGNELILSHPGGTELVFRRVE